MKQLLLLIPFSLFITSAKELDSFEKRYQQDARKFYLQFVTVGFGSNMFKMQPVFEVKGTKFIYTSEEVWVHPGQANVRKKTLLTGSFRTSSMDSISDLIRAIKDSSIHKVNMYVMSGSAAYITIEDGSKKIGFNLHNTSDTTADRIVSILNTYIPQKLRHLYICCEPVRPD